MINSKIRIFVFLFITVVFFSSCDLPADIALIKKSVSTGGGNTVADPLAGITLYLTGQDENTHACLWIVSSSGVITNVLSTLANSGTGGTCLSNGDLYIAGSDGPWGASHNSGYWVIPTNGGTAVMTVIVPGPYGNIINVFIDAAGTIWTAGGTGSLDSAAYWTNGNQVDMDGGAGWENVGDFTVITNVFYASYHSSGSFSYVNGMQTSLFDSGYSAGVLVTNGVVYITAQALSGDTNYLYISSNGGASFGYAILDNGNIPIGKSGNLVYDSGILYIGGNLPGGIAPCYWTVNSASGAVNQVFMPHTSGTNCVVSDMVIRGSVIYAAGADGGYACYWTGNAEYFLGPNVSASSVSGIRITP